MASVENDIPAKILNECNCNDIVSPYSSNIYYDTNYLPVSLLPILSKLYERNIYKSTFLYIEKFISTCHFEYRKGHSAQQCLMVMIEMWGKALDNKKIAGSVLTDLSKAFDCRDPLIGKVEAYG